MLRLESGADDGDLGCGAGLVSLGVRVGVAAILGLQPRLRADGPISGGLVRQNQQAAFTAGLIHAVGLLAMRTAMPQVVALDAEVGALELKRERLERQAFGFCYSQASAWLVQSVAFPERSLWTPCSTSLPLLTTTFMSHWPVWCIWLPGARGRVRPASRRT